MLLLFLSLFITSKTLKGALEVIIRSQIATVFNRILFQNLIIFGNFWQLLATFGNFVNLGESCQKLLRTPPPETMVEDLMVELMRAGDF